MNACPTSNPMTSKSSQYDRDAASSRSSLRTSQRHARISGERKKDLFESRCTRRETGALAQLVHSPFADHASIAQEHHAIADAGGVGELMDGLEQRSA